MNTSHEEADTRMIAHLSSNSTPANVVIHTSDRDVLAIALWKCIENPTRADLSRGGISK